MAETELPGGGEPLDAVDEQLIAQLADRARSQGLQLTGEGGLLARLTKTVIESALEGELDDHLGYAKHDPVGRNGGDSRNGRRGKTVLTDIGPVEIAVPGIGTAVSSPSCCPSISGGCPGWRIW
jgi:hypothetical protein